jgi:hypothetical protein
LLSIIFGDAVDVVWCLFVAVATVKK